MRRFKSYAVKEFKDYIENLTVKRPINHIQLHHTWEPTKSDYINADNKERIIWGMWNYHVNQNGWSDIGQHFTVLSLYNWILLIVGISFLSLRPFLNGSLRQTTFGVHSLS